MTRIFIAGLIGALMFSFPNNVMAQVHDYRAGLEQSPVGTVSVNPTFEENHNRTFDVHFSFMAPEGTTAMQTQSRVPENGNMYEIQYKTTDGDFLEFLTISNGTIDAPTPELVHQALFDVIDQFVYPSLQFSPDAEVLGGRRSDFNGLAALEFMAVNSQPGQAVIVARIVAVVAPNGRDVVFFVQQTSANAMGLSGPDDMVGTYAGGIAQTIDFIAFRDGTGVMVPF